MRDTGDSSMEARRHALLNDVAAFTTARLAEYLGKSEAELVANDLADHLADYWGGQLINFPKDFRHRLMRRELEIYDAFKAGWSLGDLARQHNISERGLRKLIDRVRERLRKAATRHTHDLFNDE